MRTDQSKVYCVVPNWNGQEFLGDAVRSLLDQSAACTVVVVDNGSTDGSVALLHDKFPAVRVVELLVNRGFAGGVNAGIKLAVDEGAAYVALFNNDAEADRDWLKHLLAAAHAHPKVGIVTGKLLRADHKHLDSTGDFYSTRGLPFPRGRNEVDDGQYNQAGPVFGASGGASLYQGAMFEQIGLFDERFFAYYEDDDISFRAQLAGWQVWYEPRAKAYHRVGGTSSKLGSFARYHSVKNLCLGYFKNWAGWLWLKYLPLFVAQLARMAVGSLRDGQFGAYLKGVSWAVAYTPSTLRLRHKVQSGRQISVAQADELLYHGRPPRPAVIKGGR